MLRIRLLSLRCVQLWSLRLRLSVRRGACGRCYADFCTCCGGSRAECDGSGDEPWKLSHLFVSARAGDLLSVEQLPTGARAQQRDRIPRRRVEGPRRVLNVESLEAAKPPQDMSTVLGTQYGVPSTGFNRGFCP